MKKKPKSLDSSKSKAPTIVPRQQRQTAGMGPVARFSPAKGQTQGKNVPPRANTSTNARRMLPGAHNKHNAPSKGIAQAKAAFSKMKRKK